MNKNQQYYISKFALTSINKCCNSYVNKFSLIKTIALKKNPENVLTRSPSKM